ncbi:MAG: 50S ribosome-binding GTPase [Treponema sp.]|jgi:Fe2+ transport system protein B|nr:50S ribosome-binding GTPase [Treponema sp.]
MRFALAGNQNSGKTTLFNQLTGLNQHVGNFPGVTVEQKSGDITGYKDTSIVDLPGVYSLSPYTNEEIVTRDFLLKQKPDGIINIVDATCIERSLYLTMQLIELQIPMVLTLNFMEQLQASKGSIDIQQLSASLGIPVVPISPIKKQGLDELMEKAVEAVLTGASIADIGNTLHTLFSPLSAASFLVFTLLYTPCVAAIATVRRELGSLRGTFFVILYQTGFAWLVAFCVYHIGRLFI